MHTHLAAYFDLYPASQAPFMHQQWHAWQREKPLAGLKVLHHLPLVQNTLLKIACIAAAGAEVVVTNPSFLAAHPSAVQALQAADILYVPDLSTLINQPFDIYFDCNAELFKQLGSPILGAVEVTASGDHYYRQQSLSFPVVSIDPTHTKQIETVFGIAQSASMALAQLSGIDIIHQHWLLFGFGKIGRGLAYFCKQHGVPLIVIDPDPQAKIAAKTLAIHCIDPADLSALQIACTNADIIVTATGRPALLSAYPTSWFTGKILANMGVHDEYGDSFKSTDVLNNKLPINFALTNPTPIQYIDTTFYAHNRAAQALLSPSLKPGTHTLSAEEDLAIVAAWCTHHGKDRQEMDNWFVKYAIPVMNH